MRYETEKLREKFSLKTLSRLEFTAIIGTENFYVEHVSNKEIR